MCSSESDADVSSYLSPCGADVSGPAMGTRKRNRENSFIFSDSQGEQEDDMDIREEGGDEFGNVGLDQDQESDDDFVVVKKKGRPRKFISSPRKLKIAANSRKARLPKRPLTQHPRPFCVRNLPMLL